METEKDIIDLSKKENWLWKFWYNVAYCYNIKRPEYVSICELFWRGIFFGLMYIFCYVIVLLGFLIFIPIVSIVAVFFCYRISLNCGLINLVPIKKWPKIYGHKILPIYIIGIPLLLYLYLYPYLSGYSFLQILNMPYNLLTLTALFVYVFTLVVALAVLVTGPIYFFTEIVEYIKQRTQTFGPFRSYIRAKKEKVCPIKKFINIS